MTNNSDYKKGNNNPKVFYGLPEEIKFCNNCTYNNTRNYNGTGIYEKWIVGKMEVNLNSGKKKKFLYL